MEKNFSHSQIMETHYGTVPVLEGIKKSELAMYVTSEDDNESLLQHSILQEESK